MQVTEPSFIDLGPKLLKFGLTQKWSIREIFEHKSPVQEAIMKTTDFIVGPYVSFDYSYGIVSYDGNGSSTSLVGVPFKLEFHVTYENGDV